ncbi:MAG: DUF1761 domain-containing protein [Flavobacteriales bacterium]|nr:DUF1761 domain-containing protein [Flavobacteriales bacterium]
MISKGVSAAIDFQCEFWVKMMLDKYGKSFRSFGHGVLHGVILSLFLVLPVLGTNALHERRGFKYIAINVAFWAVSLGLMGGIICKYA